MAGHFASVRALGVVRSGDTFDQIYDATYVHCTVLDDSGRRKKVLVVCCCAAIHRNS